MATKFFHLYSNYPPILEATIHLSASFTAFTFNSSTLKLSSPHCERSASQALEGKIPKQWLSSQVIESRFHARGRNFVRRLALTGYISVPNEVPVYLSLTYWQTWTNDSAQHGGRSVRAVRGLLTKRGRAQVNRCARAPRHYHIMLVCNYKLSYPRVNPAALRPTAPTLSQICISRALSAREPILRDRYPSSSHPPSRKINLLSKNHPPGGQTEILSPCLRSKVKNVRLA